MSNGLTNAGKPRMEAAQKPEKRLPISRICLYHAAQPR